MNIIKQFYGASKKIIECKISIAKIALLVVYTSKLLNNFHFGY
jgi:hypothetical protein